MIKIPITEYIQESLKHTYNTTVWKWIFGTSIPSFISTLFIFGKSIKEKWGIPAFNTILIVAIIVTIIFLFRFLDKFWKLIKEFKIKRFEEAVAIESNLRLTKFSESINSNDGLILLRNSFSKIRMLNVTPDEKAFTNLLVELCTIIKGHFDKQTQLNCCVSIKVPVTDTNTKGIYEKYVRNICRDEKHQTKRETVAYLEKRHTIGENTPYENIVRNLLKGKVEQYYYINTNIDTSSNNYKNSSIDTYHNEKLPYQSEIVVPILPNYIDKHMCLGGFLCVDCEHPFNFNESSDVLLLQIISNDMYDVITTIFSTLNMEKTEDSSIPV